MAESDELKTFLRTSQGILPDDERRQIAQSCDDPDQEATFNTLTEGVSPNFDERLSAEQINGFLDFIHKGEQRHPKYLVELGNILRSLGSKSEEAPALNTREKQIISLGIRYLEDWMYRAGCFNLPEYKAFHNIDPSDYLAVACFLVNQLAKIKELETNHDLYRFDNEKMKKLFKDTDAFIEERIFSQDASQVYDETLVSLRQRRGELDQHLFGLRDQFRNLMAEAGEFLAKSADLKNGKKFTPQDVIKLLKGEKIFSDQNTFSLPDRFTDSATTIDKEIELKESEREEVNEQISQQEAELLSLQKVNLTLLKKETQFSRQMCLRNEAKSAGDLYFLKTVIIAAEIIRRKEGSELIDFSLPDTHFDMQGAVFDFDNEISQSNDKSSYRKVHFKRSSLRYAYMVALYLKHKESKV